MGGPTLEESAPGVVKLLRRYWGWRREEQSQDAPEEKEDRRNQADRLIGYALDGHAGLFVDQHGEPHALIGGDPVPLNSRCYSWLRRLMWEWEEKAVNGEYLRTAAGTLAAHAEFSGEVRELHTRAAYHDGTLYYELGAGRVVKASAGGWGAVENPPVLFRRFSNLKPLPDPEPGGSLDEIDALVNIKTEGGRRLFKAYLATAALPHVPRPILGVTGAMGSGKTTIGRMVKRMWDPTAPETVRYDPRDILQKAAKASVLMLDNVSTLSEAAADTCCRLVTGEADSKRKLYTDDEDVIVEVKRAVILNGINVPTDRGDVLDRSLMVELERIPDGERRTEEELWDTFNREHPRLLGAALSVLSQAIALKSSIQLSRRPRLADWGEYAAAVYEVMGWGAEQFLEDWDEVVRAQNRSTLDGSPVAQAVIFFMQSRKSYTGSASQLHKTLEEVAERIGVSTTRDKAWPKSARWLWRRINEVLPLLVSVGIEASRERDESGSTIALRRVPTNDASDASDDENREDKPDVAGIKGGANARSNASEASNARSNASQNPAQTKGSCNTGNTGIRFGNISEAVRKLLNAPPEGIKLQVEKCRQEEAPTHQVKALAAAAAAELLGSPTRGGEVLKAVEAYFHPPDCPCEECQ